VAPDVSVKEALAILAGSEVIRRVGPARVGRTAFRLGRAGAAYTPYGIAALLLIEGYIHRDDLTRVARAIADRLPPPAPGQGGDPTFGSPVIGGKRTKRVISKANKAMKAAMKVTKNKFKQATKIASKANPNTKSKIGKGKSFVQRAARKIRKKIWGKLRR